MCKIYDIVVDFSTDFILQILVLCKCLKMVFLIYYNPVKNQRRREKVNLISQNPTPRISLMITKQAMLTRFLAAGAFISGTKEASSAPPSSQVSRDPCVNHYKDALNCGAQVV